MGELHTAHMSNEQLIMIGLGNLLHVLIAHYGVKGNVTEVADALCSRAGSVISAQRIKNHTR